jgi:hypothetical protein
MRARLALVGWIVLGACGNAAAQGYFDFGSIPGVPDQPTVQVDLNAALIGFAASAARVNDPVAAQMLEEIEGIRVRVYERLDNAGQVTAFIGEASERLEAEGWQRVVFVQEDGEMVRVYARMNGQEMNGMTIMVVDSEEAVFVNVAGRIDPEVLGRIAGNMGFADVLTGFTGSPSRYDWPPPNQD